MKTLIIALLILAAVCSDLIVTKDYVAYLKQNVAWEVEDYETSIFKGWTLEEAKSFLGLMPEEETTYPEYKPHSVPQELSWADDKCVHEVRNQGNCGSCWAFAAAGMLTDRCCLFKSDEGWLSPQELVSCSRQDMGCNGGYMASPINYMVSNKGLVREACFPYEARNGVCPSKCADGGNWKSAHVCNCVNPKSCSSTASLKSCIQTGPVSASFMVCQSFFSYKSGIYKCDCSSYIGGHAVLAVGYGDTPECYILNKNSWSHVWGDKGYFKIACRTCGYSGGYMCTNVN